MKRAFALKANEKDNVATVFENTLQKGDEVEVRDKAGNTQLLKALAAIPYGHKIALCPIAAGQTIIKYGEAIGEAVEAVAEGDYVHVHNMKALRGRGDLRGGSV